MKIGWLLATVVLGAVAALALLRVIEKAVAGSTGHAGIQLVIAAVFGWLAVKALSKARARPR